MENDKYHLWSYFRDKRGVVEALEGDFPETLANSVYLMNQVNTIKVLQRMIDEHMTLLEEQADANLEI